MSDHVTTSYLDRLMADVEEEVVPSPDWLATEQLQGAGLGAGAGAAPPSYDAWLVDDDAMCAFASDSDSELFADVFGASPFVSAQALAASSSPPSTWPLSPASPTPSVASSIGQASASASASSGSAASAAAASAWSVVAGAAIDLEAPLPVVSRPCAPSSRRRRTAARTKRACCDTASSSDTDHDDDAASMASEDSAWTAPSASSSPGPKRQRRRARTGVGAGAGARRIVTAATACCGVTANGRNCEKYGHRSFPAGILAQGSDTSGKLCDSCYKFIHRHFDQAEAKAHAKCCATSITARCTRRLEAQERRWATEGVTCAFRSHYPARQAAPTTNSEATMMAAAAPGTVVVLPIL